MKCRKCGFELPKGNSFCVACGTSAQSQPPPQQQGQTPHQHGGHQHSQRYGGQPQHYQPPPQQHHHGGQQPYHQNQPHQQYQPYHQPPPQNHYQQQQQQNPKRPKRSGKWTPMMITGFVLSVVACALAVWFWWSISWFGLVMSISTLGLGIAGLIIGLKNKREGNHPIIVVSIILGAVAIGLGAIGVVYMASCMACVGVASGCVFI